MIKKTLISLVDYAIFPAVLIVGIKILSIIVLLNYLGIDYKVSGAKLILSDFQSFVVVNSYSSYLMLAVIISGLSWVLIKAHLFHDTHISPALTSKLYNMDMEDIIESTKVIYSQSFIWISYLWIVSLMFGVQVYFGLTYKSLFYVSLGLAVLMTFILAIDLEKELTEDRKAAIKSLKSKLASKSK